METLHEITSKDAPFLLHAISLWKTYFACDLEKEQLLLWAERNPQDSILRAFEVANSWAKDRRPTVMGHDAICRYITSVLKNKARLRNKWEEVVGDGGGQTPTISLTVQQAVLVRDELQNTLREMLSRKDELSNEGMGFFTDISVLHKELTTKLAGGVR